MLKSIFLFLCFSSVAKAGPPIHCSPNPPNGTLYALDPNVKYDVPIPDPCYPVMRKDGSIMEPALLKFQSGAFIEDPDLLLARAAAKAQDANDKATAKIALVALKVKIKAKTATAADVRDALALILDALNLGN